jgi:hypothetical protein
VQGFYFTKYSALPRIRKNLCVRKLGNTPQMDISDLTTDRTISSWTSSPRTRFHQDYLNQQQHSRYCVIQPTSGAHKDLGNKILAPCNAKLPKRQATPRRQIQLTSKNSPPHTQKKEQTQQLFVRRKGNPWDKVLGTHLLNCV